MLNTAQVVAGAQRTSDDDNQEQEQEQEREREREEEAARGERATVAMPTTRQGMSATLQTSVRAANAVWSILEHAAACEAPSEEERKERRDACAMAAPEFLVPFLHDFNGGGAEDEPSVMSAMALPVPQSPLAVPRSVPAVIDTSAGTTISYDGLRRRAEALARFIVEKGIGDEDFDAARPRRTIGRKRSFTRPTKFRIGVMMRNSLDVMTVHFAAAAVGATVLNLNTHLVGSELAYILSVSAPVAVLVVDVEFADAIKDATKRLLRKSAHSVHANADASTSAAGDGAGDREEDGAGSSSSSSSRSEATSSSSSPLPFGSILWCRHDRRARTKTNDNPACQDRSEGGDDDDETNDSVPTLSSLFELRAMGVTQRNLHSVVEDGVQRGDRAPVVSAGNSPEDPYQLYFTSGTTGRPKGVLLSSRIVTLHALATIREMRINRLDVWGHFAPMFHLVDAFGIVAVTVVGGRHVVTRSFSALQLFQTIEKERISVTNIASTMLTLAMSSPHVHAYDLSSLRIVSCGGSPVAASVISHALARLGCEFFVSYGMTETCGKISMSFLTDRVFASSPPPEQLRRICTSGRPFCMVDVRVVDSNGNDVASDGTTVGEVVVRGKTVFTGYMETSSESLSTVSATQSGSETTPNAIMVAESGQEEVLSSQASTTQDEAAGVGGPTTNDDDFYDGVWFRTGDLATKSGDGYLRIVDRAKDMILVGGENVYSVEVEDVLQRHPSVAEVAVFGIPDDVMGESVAAAVVLRDGCEASFASLLAICKNALSEYKLPYRIEFLDALPKTGSGKVQKRNLAERFARSRRRGRPGGDIGESEIRTDAGAASSNTASSTTAAPRMSRQISECRLQATSRIRFMPLLGTDARHESSDGHASGGADTNGAKCRSFVVFGDDQHLTASVASSVTNAVDAEGVVCVADRLSSSTNGEVSSSGNNDTFARHVDSLVSYARQHDSSLDAIVFVWSLSSHDDDRAVHVVEYALDALRYASNEGGIDVTRSVTFVAMCGRVQCTSFTNVDGVQGVLRQVASRHAAIKVLYSCCAERWTSSGRRQGDGDGECTLAVCEVESLAAVGHLGSVIAAVVKERVHELPRAMTLCYRALCVTETGEIEEEVLHDLQAGTGDEDAIVYDRVVIFCCVDATSDACITVLDYLARRGCTHVIVLHWEEYDAPETPERLSRLCDSTSVQIQLIRMHGATVAKAVITAMQEAARHTRDKALASTIVLIYTEQSRNNAFAARPSLEDTALLYEAFAHSAASMSTSMSTSEAQCPEEGAVVTLNMLYSDLELDSARVSPARVLTESLRAQNVHAIAMNIVQDAGDDVTKRHDVLLASIEKVFVLHSTTHLHVWPSTVLVTSSSTHGAEATSGSTTTLTSGVVVDSHSVRTIVLDAASALLGSSELSTSEPIMDQGMTSALAVAMSSELEHAFGLELPATLVFDYPNLDDMSRAIHETYLRGNLCEDDFAGGDDDDDDIFFDAMDADDDLLLRADVSLPTDNTGVIGEGLLALVKSEVSSIVGSVVDDDVPLQSAGVSSAAAVALVESIERKVGTALPSTLVFDYPTTNDIVAYVDGMLIDTLAHEKEHDFDSAYQRRFSNAFATTSSIPVVRASTTSAARTRKNESLIITSFTQRLPGWMHAPRGHGGVSSSTGYGHTVVSPQGATTGDCISLVPALMRWELDGRVCVGVSPLARFGGFVEGVDIFDPDAFRITPGEAVCMDPQQRLLLSLAGEQHMLMETASQRHVQQQQQQMGVYVGISMVEYRDFLLQLKGPATDSAFFATGAHLSVAAGRISFAFNLKGPSLSVDTACSSSLVAMHVARHDMNGVPIVSDDDDGAAEKDDDALVAGANLALIPQWTSACWRAGMLSEEGRCKTLDASADGYVRSEAIVMARMRRMRRAIVYGDTSTVNSHGAILFSGAAVNQDGRSSALTAPNGPSQQRVIFDALRSANLTPSSVEALQMHGTGTPLGDPIEVGAASAVLGSSGPHVALTAFKSRIGHAEPAAGIAGCLQTYLSLCNLTQPCIENLRSVNPYLFTYLSSPNRMGAFRGIAACPTSLDSSDHSRQTAYTVGVSSFAFQGTNAHVILLKDMQHTEDALHEEGDVSRRFISFPRRHWPLPFSLRGSYVSSTTTSASVVFVHALMHPSHAMLYDHVVMGRVVVPGAAFFDLMVSGVRSHLPGGDGSVTAIGVSGVALVAPLILRSDAVRGDETRAITIECSFDTYNGSVRLSSSSVFGAPSYSSSAHVHAQVAAVASARGAQQRRDVESGESAVEASDDRRRAACPMVPLQKTAMYPTLLTHGLQYQPRFQYMTSLRTPSSPSQYSAEDKLFGHLHEPVCDDATAHSLHPSVCDAALQAAFLADIAHERVSGSAARVPVAVEYLRVALDGVFSSSRRGGYCTTSCYDEDEGFSGSHSTADYVSTLSIRREAAPVAILWRFHARSIGSAPKASTVSEETRDGSEVPRGENHMYAMSWSVSESASRARRAKRVPDRRYSDTHAQTKLAVSCGSFAAFMSSTPLLSCDAVLDCLHGVTAVTSDDDPIVAVVYGNRGGEQLHGRGEDTAVKGLLRSTATELATASMTHVDLGHEAAAVCMPNVAARHVPFAQSGVKGSLSETRIVANASLASSPELRHMTAMLSKDFILLRPARRGSIDTFEYVPQKSVFDISHAVHSVRPFGDTRSVAIMRIMAVGLNFRDLLNVLDMYPGDPGDPGSDCSGILVAHSSAMPSSSVAISSSTPATKAQTHLPHVDIFTSSGPCFGFVHGCLGTGVIVTSEDVLSTMPLSLTFAEAATVPTVFTTSLIALSEHQSSSSTVHSAARRALIPAASGGVGLSSVMLLNASGSTVFSTAGTPTKRCLLRANYGVAHSASSRDLRYVTDCVAKSPAGVDVILNSLTSPGMIGAATSLLRTGGRFVEIGKRDIFSTARVQSERSDVGYAILAVDFLPRRNAKRHLRDLAIALHDGVIRALPQTGFGLICVARAMRHMSKARHIGKIVLSASAASMASESTTGLDGLFAGPFVFLGGNGGLGGVVTKWMRLAASSPVKAAHTRVHLCGRNARRCEVDLTDPTSGAVISLRAGDVSFSDDLASMLEGHLGEPKFTSLFHASGVLRDGIVSRQNLSNLRTVLSPKVRVLAQLRQNALMDTLTSSVLFSSVASLIGAAGQTPYAAANAALDAWAEQATHEGHTACSIQWGAWAGAGMASRDKAALERARRTGIGCLNVYDGLSSMSALMRNASRPTVTCVSPFDWKVFLHRYRTVPHVYSDYIDRAFGDATSSAIRDGHVPSKESTGHAVASTSSDGKRRGMGIAQISEAIALALRTVLGHDVAMDDPLMEAGIDSLASVEFRNMLSADVGIALPGTLIFDYPSANAVAAFLHESLGSSTGADSIDDDTYEQHEKAAALQKSRGHVQAEAVHFSTTASLMIITIDGMHLERVTDCDTDGSIARERDLIHRVRHGRWDINAPSLHFGDADSARFTCTLCNVEMFDNVAFRLTGPEALWMDPQQRKLATSTLKTVRTCSTYNDSSTSPNLDASPQALRSSCFVGISWMEYQSLLEAARLAVGVYSATGGNLSVAAGRLSYMFGLKGPSASVDTACSSSLVSTHFGYQSIVTGESTDALICGINMTLTSRTTAMFSRAGMLSADGRCKTLDASADGYVRAESCGSLKLTLSGEHKSTNHANDDDAQHTNRQEHHHASFLLLRSTAVNQDGRSSSLTAPNGPSQQHVMRDGLRVADMCGPDLKTLQMHGTGTPLGDPIEMGAACAVLRSGGGADCRGELMQPLVLAAVKASCGHAEPAAGITGIIQSALLQSKYEIAPILHLRAVNAHVVGALEAHQMECRGLNLPRQKAPIAAAQHTHSLTTGVSSFAFQGTNAFATLDSPMHVPKCTHHASSRERGVLRSSTIFVESRHWCAAPSASLCDSFSSSISSLTTYTSVSIIDVTVDTPRLAYMWDHRVKTKPLFPAAGFFEVCIATASVHVKDDIAQSSTSGLGLQGTTIAQALILSSGCGIRCEVNRFDGTCSVTSMTGRAQASRMTQHLSTTIVTSPTAFGAASHKSQVTRPLSAQLRASIHVNGEDASGYVMHPSVTDALLQLGTQAIAKDSDDTRSALRIPVSASYIGMDAVAPLLDGDMSTSEASASAVPVSDTPMARPEDLLIDYRLDTQSTTMSIAGLLAKSIGSSSDDSRRKPSTTFPVMYESCWLCADEMPRRHAYDASGSTAIDSLQRSVPSWEIMDTQFYAPSSKAMRASHYSLPLLVTSTLQTGRVDVSSVRLRTLGAFSFASPCSSSTSSERALIAASGTWGLLRTAAKENSRMRVDALDMDARTACSHSLYESSSSTETSKDCSNAAYGTSFQNGVLMHSVLRTSSLVRAPLCFTIVPSPRGSLSNLRLVPGVEGFGAMPSPGHTYCVSVCAVGVNFRDLLNVLDMYPGDPGMPGSDFSGTVLHVSASASSSSSSPRCPCVGESVFGLAGGSLASSVCTSTTLPPKPISMSHEAAASTPTIFLTALTAFTSASRSSSGMTAFVHAAAGGVGLACTQVSSSLGMRFFGTAGSERKRNYLRSSAGSEAVSSSRSTSFAEVCVMLGPCVDVVLNSLTSTGMIAATTSMLSCGGSLVEIGKRDIWSMQRVQCERRDVSYTLVAIDFLPRGCVERDLLGLSTLLQQGSVQPPRDIVHGIADTSAALRQMSQATHIGKIIVRASVCSKPSTVMGSVSLIVGGMGGLGTLIASWDAQKGRQRVWLIGRSGRLTASTAYTRVLELLHGKSMTCFRLERCDASRRSEVESRMQPPFGWTADAVMHAGGVLADAMLGNQTPGKFRIAYAPKMRAGVCMHRSLDNTIHSFINFSSIASLIGSSGQGNYSAANRALEFWSDCKLASGLQMKSVQWGAWATVGMASNDVTADVVRKLGVGILSLEEGIGALEILLASAQSLVDVENLCVSPFDWVCFLQNRSARESSEFFRELRPEVERRLSESAVERAQLEGQKAVQPVRSAAKTATLESVFKMLGESFNVVTGGAGEGAVLDTETPLVDMGMDSLSIVEFKQDIFRNTGIEMPRSLDLAATLTDIAALIVPDSSSSSSGASSGSNDEIEEELSAGSTGSISASKDSDTVGSSGSSPRSSPRSKASRKTSPRKVQRPLLMEPLLTENETPTVMQSRAHIPLWYRILASFSLLYNWIATLLRPLFGALTSTYYVCSQYAERIVPLSSDDTFLTKHCLERTVYFETALDLDRLIKTIGVVADAFPALASTIVMRGGKLFLRFGGKSNPIPLRVTSRSYDAEHWKKVGVFGVIVEVANRQFFPFHRWATFVRVRTVFKALNGHGAGEILWPQPVVQLELIHVKGQSVNGDFLNVKVNHAVADGFVFDKFFVSLMTAYEGKQLSATGQNEEDVRNLRQLRSLMSTVPMPLLPHARLDPDLGGHAFWWGKVTGATIDRFRRESGSSTTRDTDIIIAMLWSAMRTFAVEEDSTTDHDVMCSVLCDMRSGISGLDSVAGNLVWWSRPFVPEQSQSRADTAEVALRNVERIRKFRNGYSVSIDGIKARLGHHDADSMRKAPIPGSYTREALDPNYSTPYYCEEETHDYHFKPARRHLLAVNDTSWLLSRFTFTDPVTGVRHDGRNTAHPSDPNINQFLPSLTFKVIPEKLRNCRVWYVSLFRARDNPAKARAARASGGSSDMQVMIIGGQEINES